MKEKNLKKVFLIVGIVAAAIYLVGFLISTGISLFSSSYITGSLVLSNLWALTKAFVLYGFVLAFFIYEMVKKSDKKDRVLNIILFVVFCLLALSCISSIFSRINTLVKAAYYLNGLTIVSYIIDILNGILRIGLFVLLGINTIFLVLSKSKAAKILTFIIIGLIALVFLNSILSTILLLIGKTNVRLILISLGSLFNGFSLSVFQASLAYIIYDKLKGLEKKNSSDKAK